MPIPASLPPVLAAALLVSACASTNVTFTPVAPPASLCQARSEQVSALVLWAPEWRPNQKDVPLREAAAEQGITRFFSSSACFAQYEVRRAPLETLRSDEQLRQLVAGENLKPVRVLVIVVRELGPVVKLLSSSSLVEGGTEVVLNISEYRTLGTLPSQSFSVHWQHGGPGVIKGVASLPADMEASLVASLRPGAQ